VLIGYHGCHDHNIGVVLVVSRGNKAPAQEGPFRSLPMDVLSIRLWSHMLLMRLLLLLFSSLNSKGDFWEA
jgi:hypothetical protein